MTELMALNVVLAGLNLVLAALLGAVYLKNHRALKSPFTLGLLLFSLFLVLHNGMAVYHFVTMMGGPAQGEGFLAVENVLQSAGLVALVAATMR